MKKLTSKFKHVRMLLYKFPSGGEPVLCSQIENSLSREVSFHYSIKEEEPD